MGGDGEIGVSVGHGSEHFASSDVGGASYESSEEAASEPLVGVTVGRGDIV